MWGLKIETKPVVLDALRLIENGLTKYTEKITGSISTSELQKKKSLLGTAHVLG